MNTSSESNEAPLPGGFSTSPFNASASQLEGIPTNAPVSRPGISTDKLAMAKVRMVNAAEANQAVGFAHAGLLIPYNHLDGCPLIVNGQPFVRLRVSAPGDGPRYLSPRGSGCQAYLPPTLGTLLGFSRTLVLVEGEFKALALTENFVAAVGIGGIASACPKNDNGEPELLPAIRALIDRWKIERLLFLGDSDTALIPEFASEAIKLGKTSGLTILLPRIPVDAPGKGPDDLREIMGWTDFNVFWKKIAAEAEPVNAKDTPASVAVRLLSREKDALKKLSGEPLKAAQKRIVKLAASMQGDALELAEVEEVATNFLGLKKAALRSAVRVLLEERRREASESIEKIVTETHGPSGSCPMFFEESSGKAYWRRNDDGTYGCITREDARLELNKSGFSKVGDPSPCDAALNLLQKRNRVDYAGPLCGRPPGLHVENSKRVLVTRGPTWIEGRFGYLPLLAPILRNLFGCTSGDPHHETQLYLFLGWLKLARHAIRNYDKLRPGQVLALVGPPDCGKSLLQSEIITPALGGRVADPSLYLTGQTTFNADLWGAEHWAIGDKALDVEGAQRATLRNELKRLVAEPMFPLHSKHKDGQTFRLVGRISISANSDPDSASNLPSVDAAFADKIIYLLCHAPLLPFFDANLPGAREYFVQQLRSELPAFLGWVDTHEIPVHLRAARFGIKEWHHPEILKLLSVGNPLSDIAEILERFLSRLPQHQGAIELPTVELFAALDVVADGNLARHKICSGPKQLGYQLSGLTRVDGWQGRLTRIDFREGPREINKRIRGWRISR